MAGGSRSRVAACPAHRFVRRLAQTATKRAIEFDHVGLFGQTRGDKRLLRRIERALRIQHIQKLVHPGAVTQFGQPQRNRGIVGERTLRAS